MRGRTRRQARDTQDDSEEPDSGAETDAFDSDGVTNGRISNKRKTIDTSTRRRRAANKRQRIQDESDDDSLTQPSTSGVNSRFNGQNDSDVSNSDSDTPAVTQSLSKEMEGTELSNDMDKEKLSNEIDGTENVMTNGTSLNAGQASSTGKRGRPPRRAVRSKPADDSDDNTSPQPSTSGINSRQRNGVQDDSDFDPQRHSDSGSETPDSDFMPVDDARKSSSKISSTSKKRGKSVRSSPRSKKQSVQSNSFGGVDSQKDSRGLTRLNSSVNSKSQRDSVSFDPNHIEALAQRCVYFLLIEDQKKYAIKRKAIVTHVFKDEAYSPKLYSNVILKANMILMKTFGMELMELENQKDSYLLVNILKRELSIEEFIELPRLKHQQQGLVLYLLTVIFMNNNCITEVELIKALKELNIDYTSKKPHAVFGDVKKFITTDLVKQMYLNYECINKDPPQYEITWGLRAKEEVDKRDLLQFACKVMDDTKPESWILQYKDAEESASPE